MKRNIHLKEKIIKHLEQISTYRAHYLYQAGKLDYIPYLERLQYPQTWNIVHHLPFSRRWIIISGHYYRNPIYRLLTVLCGLLIDHEKSSTEYGYGGGAYIDRNCRWCDKGIAEYIEDSDWEVSLGLREIMNKMSPKGLTF